MKEVIHQPKLVQDLEGLFDFQDGYTFEDGMEFTSTVNHILRDRYQLPVHLVLDWEPGCSQLLVLTPDVIEGHYRAKALTMPYMAYEEEDNYHGTVRAFVDELLLFL